MCCHIFVVENFREKREFEYAYSQRIKRENTNNTTFVPFLSFVVPFADKRSHRNSLHTT